MIRTLRITSVIAAIAALVLLVLPVVYGVREDTETEEYLGSATAVEAFKKAAGQKRTKGQNQVSPLVKQAEAFAKYLNPPAKVSRPKKSSSRATTRKPATRPLGDVSSKFELIATSFYESRPELSLALIDEPGKELHWIRQGGKVGHLIIEQVRDGSVTVLDGQRTFEMEVKRENVRRSLVKGESSAEPTEVPGPPGGDVRDTPAPKIPISGRQASRPSRRGRISRSPAARQPVSVPVEMSEEETARLDELIAQLQAISAEDGEDSEAAAEKRAEMMEKLMSDFESTNLSPEEAELLSRLGQELDEGRDVPPRPGDSDEDSADDDVEPEEPEEPPDPPDE